MQIAVQTFTLRDVASPMIALGMIRGCGVKVVEPHWPASGSWVEDLNVIKDTHDIHIMSYGVPSIAVDTPEDNELAFRTAKRIGANILAVDLKAGALPVLQQLAVEYNIVAAIHNHGPGQLYPGWKAVDTDLLSLAVLPAVIQLKVGICLDVGHCWRAGENPVEGIDTMGPWIFDVHLKDLDINNNDVPLGQGILPIMGILYALRDIKYRGPLVVEWETDGDPIPGLRDSLQYLRRLM